MKKLKQFFKNIYLFLYYLTPKGRDEKYWAEAGKKLEKVLFEKGVKELEIKQECIKYAKTVSKRKLLTDFHLGTLVQEKFKTKLSEVGVKIHKRNLKFKDA